MEVAFRAKHVLELLDQVYFAGVKIELSLSKESVDWSEPVDLVITLTNQSPYPTRIPFDVEGDQPQLETDAQQVGQLLDVADWLTVVSDTGSSISLQVDDYTGHADITKAIDRRLENAPTSVLPAHQKRIVKLRAINRGWARYRLLEQGSYIFKLAYQPAWNDKQLLVRRVGYTQSNEASLFIQSSAEPVISRQGLEAALEVNMIDTQDSHDMIKALLINRHDRAKLVNTNLSTSGPPFARGQWIVETDGRIARMPAETLKRKSQSHVAGDVFPHNVIAVAPGEAVEIASISYDDLNRALEEAGEASLSHTTKLRFVYTNLWNQHWIKQRLAKEPADTPQGRQWSAFLAGPRIIFGRFDSTEISWPEKK